MSNRIPILAVVGPTASGKTGLGVALAKAFHWEVLSFDSMQLYKGMDVATAKPTPEEMQGIPHHMISQIEPTDRYSVARYQEDAGRIVEEIVRRGKHVIMVGGTGQYIDAFLQNLHFLDGEETGPVRARLRQELEEQGMDPLFQRLQELDPETAARLNKNNAGRVLRALEVYETTGHTISYQVAQSKKEPSPYKPFLVGLTAKDRNYLYDRINRRVDLMLEQGLLEEAELFYETYGKGSSTGTAATDGTDRTAAQAIGLKEMVPYLEGTASLNDCVAHLKQVTRNYAKRQLTWFRRNPEVHWLEIDRFSYSEELYREAIHLVKEAAFFEAEKREENGDE